MAGVYWGEHTSAEVGAALIFVLLACYVVGGLVTTISSIVFWFRGKPITWSKYGRALLFAGLPIYGFLGFLFVLASPFVFIYLVFFR